MKNKGLLFTILVTYFLFVLLIISEPIGYDPLFLIILFFVIFLLLYLFLSGSISRLRDKLPKKTKAIISGISVLYSYFLLFLFGWFAHAYWIQHDKKEIDIVILILLVPLSINIMREGYKTYLLNR